MLRLHHAFDSLFLLLFFFQGTFVVELYYKHAPRTCYNMAALAHAGYYDGTIFHRIVRDFMVQGGDPTGTGRGYVVVVVVVTCVDSVTTSVFTNYTTPPQW